MTLTEELEEKLDSLDAATRKNALCRLCEKVQEGQIKLPQAGKDVNLHCHTFFSYNSYGYSPTKFAWLARKKGLAVAGIIDFDVLDAMDEFLDAAKILGLKGCTGLETRVFVPEFSDKVINSPGEPGIAYHIGAGFERPDLQGPQKVFLHNLKVTAQQRNRQLMKRVNDYLKPVELDYKRDVLTLTPSGNATERHICLAFARKARAIFNTQASLASFWTAKLGLDAQSLGLPESRELLNAIRAKTMKQGGAGYVLPDKGSFPLMADTNKFFLAAGAIPTIGWLDGTSDAEGQIEKLIAVARSSGAAAINIIPDRNYRCGIKDKKLANLYQIVELAEKLDLPIMVGTEMNSPSQKFVDSFQTEELAPLLPVFLKGAYIVYAHSVLQRKCRLGYMSQWAMRTFTNTKDKNSFFHQIGQFLNPLKEDRLTALTEDLDAQRVLDIIQLQMQ